jgi:hypothetical protein
MKRPQFFPANFFWSVRFKKTFPAIFLSGRFEKTFPAIFLVGQDEEKNVVFNRNVSGTVLPDGIFSNQRKTIWVNFGVR